MESIRGKEKMLNELYKSKQIQELWLNIDNVFTEDLATKANITH